VTSFFRDKDAFAALTKKALAPMLEGKKPEAVIRIWVPGCATGEEAYSIAMILLETMETLGKGNSVQVFGTDIDSAAVEYARAAEYPDSIAADVSQERLKRFFVKGKNTYRIKKHVRDMIVFAVQDLIKDPPFSRVDLVSCRNVLIYMDQVLQKKILPMFHYTLTEGASLFLGTSESIGEFADLFAPVDTKWKVFRRKGGTVDRDAGYPVMPFYTNLEPTRAEAGRTPAGADIRHLAEKVILTEYAPPCVLVNKKHEILYFYGRTDLYLSLPTGEPTYNVLRMAREELRYKLSTSLHRAEKEKRTVVSEGLKMRHDGGLTTFDLVVRPLAEPKSLQGLTMVVFEARPAPERPSGKAAGKKKARTAAGEDPRIAALEQELKSAREYLQTTIEELETSNEELQSTNEELQSSNEELQSSNEELETSKEEMQSTNEELETVNAELQSKVDELSRANDDLDNLLSSTNLATIFLDTELRIKRFTPAATGIFNLIKTDVNRPISDITAKLVDENLRKDAGEVLGTLGHKEAEVQTTDGSWFTMRILPYRTLENMIDGVVITFAGISELKRARTSAEEARTYAEGIVDTVREPLLILDGDLRVVSANRSFFKTFRVAQEETEGSLVYELGNHQWDIPKLRELLETILPRSSEFNDFTVEHDFPTIGRKKMLLNARRIYEEEKKTLLILLAIEDVTERSDT
jgi:two-component system CheB/CheR fusion protein